MGRNSKLDSEERRSEKIAESHYPYNSVWKFGKKKKLKDQDIAFCLLILTGMPATKAYRVCYNSTGNGNSIAVMTSRVRQEEWYEEVFADLRKREALWNCPTYKLKLFGR